MESEEKDIEAPIPVRVIQAKGGSSLVEWQEAGQYRRTFIPAESVISGEVYPEILRWGIPCGVAWEKYITITATAESVANEMRKRGIWCLDDLKKPLLAEVNRAFDLGEFIRRVHKEEA